MAQASRWSDNTDNSRRYEIEERVRTTDGDNLLPLFRRLSEYTPYTDRLDELDWEVITHIAIQSPNLQSKVDEPPPPCTPRGSLAAAILSLKIETNINNYIT